MSPENAQKAVEGERSPAALRAGHSAAAHEEVMYYTGEVGKQRRNIVAFKFGGSSLFGADRMLHSAGLVRSATQASNVTVVVSAMKGVTDHLLSIAQALTGGKLAHPRHEPEMVLDLHSDGLHVLQ